MGSGNILSSYVPDGTTMVGRRNDDAAEQDVAKLDFTHKGV